MKFEEGRNVAQNHIILFMYGNSFFTGVNKGIGCFHFSSEAEEVTWFEAEQYCKNLESGAWLAEIPNDVTQALLQGYNIHNQEWWIGANDLWMVKNYYINIKSYFCK